MQQMAGQPGGGAAGGSSGPPAGGVAGQARQPQQANTSINIAILDSKDFPSDVAPLEELYSEFAMADGRVLFECPELIKRTGIDLMNCPLNIVLKLHVRRRMPQGPVMLWHVVIPLPVISKYLLNAPHEWETWIGLLPNTQSLESHPAETMFTQAVHLISRPEFPKIRLRFTYHNPELQAQLLAQREQAEQEAQRRAEHNKQLGQAQFQDIHKLFGKVKDTTSQPQGRAADQMRDNLSSSTGSHSAATVMMPSPAAPVMVAAEPVAAPAENDGDVEQLLVEGLRMALMGMLDDSDGSKMPRTSTNLSATSTDQMRTIQGGYPNLWQLYREVSHLAKDRATLLSQQHELQARCLQLSKEMEQHRSNPSPSDGAETKKHFEKLLNQQRQALQLGFDTETNSLRQKIDEMRRQAAERETEVAILREQLSEFMQRRSG
mmetsp:Transcript_142942/g.252363  ORF Transcript_142942/g.252363 Transcript_142942/m.252363 type:complete len:434 (+) Transcript_142942:153-1454(+)